MEVKTFLYELKDGKQYEFSERAREDISLYYRHCLGKTEHSRFMTLLKKKLCAME